MHNFIPHPFRYIMMPGESITIILIIKANASYEDDIFEKNKEMRKILYIKIKDTNTHFSIPLHIHITNMSLDSDFSKE